MATSSAEHPLPASGVATVVSESPPRSALVLFALVTGAIVANINLGIANVALPTIGADLHASQSQLTAIGTAFTLALAASVLYFGAIGDRYGRKLMFVIGATLTVPMSFLAAYAWNPQSLMVARFGGGLAAGLLFPTTLSLITALYSGRARVHAIALWSGLGGSVAAIGPLLAGWMLERFWWGSVFLVTLPLVVLALAVGLVVLPWHSHEDPEPVDHLGGVLSVIGIAALVLTIEQVSHGIDALWFALLAVAVVALLAFVWQQRRAPRPLVDLVLVRARTFWVAALAGAITFGSLIGAMFVGQQFTQNVLGYQPIVAAAVGIPSAVMMAVFAQLSGPWLLRFGSRPVFAAGLLVCCSAFLVILLTWDPGGSMAWVLLAYGLTGTGVGLCATPASRSIMSSLPVRRAGMGSAFVDLTRDLGGAIVQSIMGVLLAVVYTGFFTKAFAALPPAQAQALGDSAAEQISSSFAGAEQVAKSFPETTANQIVSAAAKAFTDGKTAAMLVGAVLSAAAFLLVWFAYPRKDAEEAYYARMAEETEEQAAAGVG